MSEHHALGAAGRSAVLAAWRSALGLQDSTVSRSVVVRDDLDVIVLVGILGRRWSAAPAPWAAVLEREPDADHVAALCLSPGVRGLGTADLLYSDRPPPLPEADARVRPATTADLENLRAEAESAEWDEGGIDGLERRWVSVDQAGVVRAVAGYSPWRDVVAQIGVFTAAGARAAGHAKNAAAVAVSHALDETAVAQWRSRRGNTASLALGVGLGFTVLGSQSTFVLVDPRPGS